MTDNKIRSEHRVTINILFTLICLLCILTGLGSSVSAVGKQDAKPKKPRFELSGKTLVDNKTKLMWPLNGNPVEQTVSWNGAFDYIDSLNRSAYRGHTNWRLPSREELESLVEYVREQGFGGDRTIAQGLQALGLRNIRDEEYWTSTEHIYNSGEAWFVNMRSGRVGTGLKTLYFPVLPVRSLP